MRKKRIWTKKRPAAVKLDIVARPYTADRDWDEPIAAHGGPAIWRANEKRDPHNNAPRSAPSGPAFRNAADVDFL